MKTAYKEVDNNSDEEFLYSAISTMLVDIFSLNLQEILQKEGCQTLGR